MSKLFLFSLTEFFSQISLDVLILIANSLIILASLLCFILSIAKEGYALKNRLWIIFFMAGIIFVQVWIELSVEGYARYVFLTVGISVCLLSLILFLPEKHKKITQSQVDFARLISNSVKNERTENYTSVFPEKSKIISSPIIKTEQKSSSLIDDNERKTEIDFSHVKNVLNKLEYYSLKEQDKKQARELENAIISAEQNGMNVELKEKINDGLGALLKIMSKYAI